jgi:hypothetical protein
MMKNLNEIKSKNPFRVPDNYFEDVNRKIISATSFIEMLPEKKGIYRRFRSSLLIAASVTGFVLLTYTAVRHFAPGRTDSHISVIINEVNTESFINDIDVRDLEEEASSVGVYEGSPNVAKDDIIDYLILENVEINDIYAKL